MNIYEYLARELVRQRQLEIERNIGPGQDAKSATTLNPFRVFTRYNR